MIKSRILATFSLTILHADSLNLRGKGYNLIPIKISKDKVDMISCSMHLYNFRQVGMHVHEVLLRFHDWGISFAL